MQKKVYRANHQKSLRSEKVSLLLDVVLEVSLYYIYVLIEGSSRYLRNCPVPGCRSKPQRKLSQHIKYMHGYLSPQKRQDYLRSARRVDVPKKKKTVPVPKGQPTIHTMFPVHSTKQTGEGDHKDNSGIEEDDENVQSDDDSNSPALHDAQVLVNEGTRKFPKFDIALPIFLRFESYLTSIDGGMRSSKTAREITIDVSKFLRYACGSTCAHPDWRRLTDRDQLVGYVQKLTRAKVGPEGQLAKLDAFICALRFVKAVVIADCSHPMHVDCTSTEEIIARWKKALRRQKVKLRKKRLQDLSCEQLSLEEVAALIDCKLLWSNINEINMDAERGKPITTSQLNMCSIAIAGSILYKNWQRPGAVCNASLSEYQNAKTIVQDVKTRYVMSVQQHKTSQEGYAKLVLEPLDHARICQYVHQIRPLQDPEGISTNLFIVSGGRPLSKLSSRLKALGGKYTLNLPSASRVRKIGATSVAMNLGNTAKAHLVTRNMSHSLNTNAEYYQAVVGDTHAVTAFETMSELRETPKQDGTVSKEHTPQSTPTRKLQQRRPYTTKESKKIMKYFASHIESAISPSLAECKAFLDAHDMVRTPKNIQDKVRAASR